MVRAFFRVGGLHTASDASSMYDCNVIRSFFFVTQPVEVQDVSYMIRTRSSDVHDRRPH